MQRWFTFVTLTVVLGLLAAGVSAQPPWAPAHGRNQPAAFQGYWMGIDPVDGGDARRSLIQLENGRFALAAHDSVLTLCDGTEHGFGSFDDGVVAGNVLQSDSLTLQCFNVDASVVLRVRFELVNNSLMKEIATRQDGTPVSTIVFHRVSE